ncbi:hypothetical protein [Poriferisphaera sp. WC338]|uniref:hypothetical protein n=1 Tax=Poriferisphaera sp. WC338 TaxID=3425129 RepID=UPI003D818A6D
MKIECNSCGAPIASENLNLSAMIGKCTHCNSITSFAGKLPARNSDTSSPVQPKLEIDASEIRGVMIEELPDAYTITRKWFTPAAFALLGFCAIWDSFLIFWYFMAFTDDAPLMMKLFPILHVAVGICLTYAAICMLVNKTIIRLDPNALSIKHAPLPWSGNKSVQTLDIQQLFVREKVNRSKDGNATYTYAVHAQTTKNKVIKLVPNIQKAEQAQFIEQQLEKQLGITDQPVAGEYR